MRRLIAACLLTTAFVGAQARAALTRPACLVGPRAGHSCSFVARTGGSVEYATQGYVEFAVTHGSVTRRICLMGIGAGSREPGRVAKGDTVSIRSLTSNTTAVAVLMPAGLLYSSGTTSTHVCK